MTRKELKMLEEYVLDKKQDYLIKQNIQLDVHTISTNIKHMVDVHCSYTQYKEAINIFKMLTGKKV